MSDNSERSFSRNWRTVWLFDENGVNYQSATERAAILREYLSTGIMPNRATFFSFPISFANLSEIRSGKVAGNCVHALAMAIYDLETSQRVTDPMVVLAAMEQWEKSRSLPKGLSFFSHPIDQSGLNESADHKPTLKGPVVKTDLSAKYRSRV